MIVLGPVLSFSFFLLSAFLIGTLGFWAMFIGWQFIFITIRLFVVLNIFLFALNLTFYSWLFNRIFKKNNI
ncbi:hypothetical protein AUJ77_02930 [Candidatus Nomurabacteria bacterium CG1_02_43_90]|uniref:Uncharacterized protein n=1 Tax=Candidatus Nomurabacteria bacterium CG1_02_43_90 TaxID=1805281 RepID=A0A1J4V8A1_9BACT|nr:MAG: hypothetical protein AUJ77_02930 [Candidatus Nomurabacteria bacterium CG1_02_43_90]